MIAPQELRIGNNLNAVVSNGVETLNFHELIVNEIKADGIREEKGLIFPYENLLGTPLTEEWLIKFGFEKKEVYMLGVKYDGWLNFSFHLDINHIKNTYFYHWMGGNIEVKHVHQLQNLFHSLTGEELTIK